jgi:predicted nucleic acid-binding Zn finger protein
MRINEMSISVPKSPDQMRQERAITEYSSYSFRLMTVKTSAGPRGLVYVTSKSGNTYCVTDSGRCSCMDFQRRNQPYGNAPCKHIHAVGIFLNCGTATPEPVEAAADRKAQALKDRELWD